MNKPNNPLTKTEIRMGLARLMSSRLMTSAAGRKGQDGEEDDFTGALEATCDARSYAGPRIRYLRLPFEGNVSGIIEDLGIALLLDRLSAEELFRLGTSQAAMDLFEDYETRLNERMKKYRATRPTVGGEAKDATEAVRS